MDKKLVLICGAIAILAAAFIYMSFSPNTVNNNADVAQGVPATQDSGTQPPPPPPRPDNQRSATAPPPPPTGLKKATKVRTLPDGYINYEVIARPEPIQKLKMGSTKRLTLDVKKGSENFTIEWFKKGKNSSKKVNIGKTFSVSPEKNVVYYVATIDDKVNEPENIYFQVEADNSAPETTTETAPESNIAKEPVAKIVTPDEPVKTETASPPAIKDEEKEELVQEEPIKEEVKIAEIYVITPTDTTDIQAKPGSPLKIGYTVEGDSNYKVFWFHRPFNKKKGTLIKKRTKLNFSLRKLNKYHSGYFYIKIKDSAGKFYSSPEYKVTVK